MASAEIDAIDRQILDLLGDDARMSNRSIARHLGLVEGTVRARIKRMQAARLLRFTAFTDDRQQGKPNLVFIRIRTETASTRAIGQQIAAMGEVLSVVTFLGRFNLVAVGMFATLEGPSDFVRDRISPIPGVLSVEHAIVLKSIKFNERMARLDIPGEAAPDRTPS